MIQSEYSSVSTDTISADDYKKGGEKMIISASRRTDIPTYYSEWLFNRLKEEYVLVRNPMNIHQIGQISLSPDAVDGIVFWTKNPLPMLHRLSELDKYNYYFQFTLNAYDRDVEPNIPSKNNVNFCNNFTISLKFHVLRDDKYNVRYKGCVRWDLTYNKRQQ